MSIESLLIAAQYLDYRDKTAARGEEPQDYNSFLNETSGIECLSLSSSEHENIGDNVEIVETKFNEGKVSYKNGAIAIQEKSLSREVHNRLEKNRRAQMKEGFERLKQLTPNIGSGKVSNLKLLREVTKYIKELKEAQEAHQFEVRQLEMRYITLNTRKQLLSNQQSQTMESQLNQAYVNGELTRDIEDKKHVSVHREDGDDAALLFFSRVVTGGANINRYCTVDGGNINYQKSLSVNNGVMVKNEPKGNEQAGWSVSEKLMALCAAGKTVGAEQCQEVGASAAMKKCSKLNGEMKKSGDIRNEDLADLGMKSQPQSHVKVEPSQQLQELQQQNHVASAITGLKRKHGEESIRRSPEARNLPEDGGLNAVAKVAGIKAFPSKISSSPPTVIMQTACSVPVNKCHGNSSILQKVLLSSETAQCETFLAKPTALMVQHSDGSHEQKRSVLHCVSSQPQQNTLVKTAVTEVAKVHFPVVQIPRKVLNRPFDNESAIKIVDRMGKEVTTTNTSIVKFATASGVLKQDASESFRAIKVSPPVPTITQANVGNKIMTKPEKNDSMVYLVAVPNTGQKLFINGSAV